jgi:hypothetical protein
MLKPASAIRTRKLVCLLPLVAGWVEVTTVQDSCLPLPLALICQSSFAEKKKPVAMSRPS